LKKINALQTAISVNKYFSQIQHGIEQAKLEQAKKIIDDLIKLF
jgi:hypothetical protein